ncbi:MAG TPA: wax ester/triacylglycerol synthase domain-containing protein, partial [Acidimicrobiales bacterium]|nr:wax ester/triacylglycerol synthase domain-containing protein [Acidimicrobiales bacterium]
MTERLSSIEAIMWRTGHDATLRMAVGTLMILDRPPDRAAVIRRLAAAAEQAPRLRWRLDDPTGTRSRPGWVENPDFSPERHLRTMALGSPGDRSQLLDLIGLLEPSPFDPDRGPWDVTLIEGLEGGRAALYLRAHHVLTDGLGGLSLIGLLVDEAHPLPSATAPEVPEAAEPVPAEPVAEAPAKRKPGTVSINIDLTSAAAPVAQGVAAGVSFAKTINPIDMFVRSIQWGLDMASSVSHQLIVTGGRLSPIAPSGAMTSRFAVLTVPDAREAARALGGSRNDLLVAGASAGLGLYHEKVGQPCYQLRLALP